MNMIAMDTYEVVQELKAVGFTEAQAESVTRIVRKAQDVDFSSLASKNDLAGLELKLAKVQAELQRDLANTKAELQRDLANTKAELQRDLANTKAELQRDLAKGQAELQRDLGDVKRDLANTKAELLKWIIGSTGVQTIVILGAVIALVRTMSH